MRVAGLNTPFPRHSAGNSPRSSNTLARLAGGRAGAGRLGSDRDRSGDIRAWAEDRGIAVSGRGRIPASIVEQYEAAGGAA